MDVIPCVCRLLPNGSIDTSFGGTGLVPLIRALPSSGYEIGNFISTQSNGNIVVVSSSVMPDFTLRIAVSRLQPDGRPDVAFAQASAFSLFWPLVSSVVACVDETGNIFIGWGAANHVAGSKILSDGSMDLELGVTGRFAAQQVSWANSVGLSKILVVVRFENSASSFSKLIALLHRTVGLLLLATQPPRARCIPLYFDTTQLVGPI
jgi:hypothetical protein